MNNYKPKSYPALAPYLIVDEAKDLVQQLISIFDGEIMRKFEREDGKIGHLELKIEDSILMISDSVADYPAQTCMLHCYVPDVLKAFERALQAGCQEIDKPVQKEGEHDIRGAFFDAAGNYWAISTQLD